LKLLLDTTYFLPAIGISIKNLPKDAPIKLVNQNHKISISNISVFELSAIGAKYIVTEALSAERVTKGIRAIVYDEAMERIPIHDSPILLTAFKLRKILSDFVDCLILSSAINQCDALITEDSDIQNLKKDKEFSNLLAAIKPNFRIQTLNETLTSS